MRRSIFFPVALVSLFAAGCLQVDEPEPPPPEELPAEIMFSPSNLPPAVAISDTTLHMAKNSVVADFNLDGLDDIAIVEDGEEDAPPPSAGPGKADAKSTGPAPLKVPEVTVYIRAAGRKDASPDAAKMYHKAGVIPSIAGKMVAGIARGSSKQYTDLVILFREDTGGTEMIHYQNRGDRFVKIEDVRTEPEPQP